MFRLTFSQKFAYDSSGRKNKQTALFGGEPVQVMIDVFQSMLRAVSNPHYFDFVPILSYIPWIPESLGGTAKQYFSNIQNIVDKRDSILRNVLAEHRERLKNDTEPQDYLDKMILMADDATHEFKITDNEIILIMQDMIIAGAETTAATLSWFFVAITNHPQWWPALEKEVSENSQWIESVLDDTFEEEKIKFEQRFPVISRCITETMRWRPAVPFALPHRTTQDAKVTIHDKEYIVPENTMVLVNVWGACHLKEFWKNPEEWNPSRFDRTSAEFTEEGEKFALLPWGIGKRQCAGMNVAKDEMILVLAALIYKYKWSTISSSSSRNGDDHADNKNLPNPNIPRFSITFTPQNYALEITKKNQQQNQPTIKYLNSKTQDLIN